MKETFETAIKSAKKEDQTTKELLAIEKIEKYVNPETMERILELQAGKTSIVEQYSEWRKKFWDSDTTESSVEDFEGIDGVRTLTVNAEGEFVTFLKGGETVMLTKGEVLAAAEWGFWWRFDDTVAEENQKEIMSSQVRHVIAHEYDKQLVAYGKVDTLSDDRKRATYAAIEERNLELHTMPAGILAEKMIMSFLTKEMYDNPELEFSIKSVDVYEDVEHKIDFIITVKDKKRGIKVGAERQVGVQFTMNSGATERKEKQLDRVKKTALHETEVDELVLVTMPVDDIKSDFTTWSGVGKKRLDPRGPDQLWSEETKQTIIAGLVKGIGLNSDEMT